MQDVYLNPLTDFGFKKLFGEEPNKDLLISFLNTLLPAHHQVSELTYTKNEYQGISASDRTLQDKWLFAFKHLHELDRIPSVLHEKIFQRLFSIAKIAQLPPEERQVYERSLKDYRDLKSAQATAHLEGYQEGVEDGMEQGALKKAQEVAQKLLKLSSLPAEHIAQIAGLSVDEVIRLKP